MEFEDCLSGNEKNACMQLLNSLPSFQPYPHKRKIRLALSPPLFASLNLTIQHGPCDISCEGGIINSCNVTTEDLYWPDASVPYYIQNCVPAHNYCVSASIGECCPVCTKTVFMQDFKLQFAQEDRWEWNFELVASLMTVLIILLLLMAVLRNYIYKYKDYKSPSQNFQQINSDSPAQYILEVENYEQKICVVCLYIRENNVLSLDKVSSIKEFLKRKGIEVIDIYDEEENINKSIVKWVHNVLNESDTKILIFDTEAMRQLWNGALDGNKILTPVEQAICFTKSCIPVTKVHNYLFVVRFEGTKCETKTFIDLTDGRCYVFPIHKERLANDLKDSTKFPSGH